MKATIGELVAYAIHFLSTSGVIGFHFFISEDSIGKFLNYNILGVNRVQPWNSVKIKFGLGLRGYYIRPDLDNRHLIIEGH